MSDILLLDGGMGQELIARSSQPPSPLWSAKVLLDEPQIVEDVHRAYVDAGARVITLNTYSATPERLERDAGPEVAEDLFLHLQASGIELAKSAVAGTDVLVAGCLPPLKGSYQPSQAPDFDICLATYRRVVALQKDHISFFICETLSSIKEVRAAVQACAENDMPVLCGMSVMDEDGTRLRSGEPLVEAALAAKQAGATALGINCSWPEAVSQAMPILKPLDLPFGGWANAFTKADDLALGGTVDVLTTRTDLDPTSYANHVLDWVGAGATIVGGCCEVGPAHIKEIATRLQSAGHTLTGSLQ
ncbi:MAG: homocysteine S-methyltransferase family protein [Pseudomonadota bacterium]